MGAEKEQTTQIAGVQVEGTFNVQRFFDTLAALLSRREGVTITVKVTKKDEQQQKAAV